LLENDLGILLSGGIDSVALAYWKQPAFSFTIDYGQRPAQAEIHAAKQVSKYLGIRHQIISVDCSQLGSGDLLNKKPLSVAPVDEWWPYRNQLLVTLACMKGISIGIKKLIVGSVSSDDVHKDGSPEFYKSLSSLISYQEGGISIITPAINMTTIELISTSNIPESLLLWSHSCHKSNSPCMKCNGCNKYLYTMQTLGLD